MKKAVLLGIAALLALAVFSCDNFNIPKDGPKVDIDAWDLSDEPPLKEGEFFIGYNTGSGSGSRALTAPLAKAGSDYFEAVLTNGTLVHRAVFREGKYGRMMPPVNGNYDNAGSLKAYLFAGRDDDKTLLGIGVITNVDNGSGWLTVGVGTPPATTADLTTITTATKRVQFTIEALETDVNTDACKTTPAAAVNTSTFRPWTTPADEVVASARIRIDNLPASIFLLAAQSSISATYDIKTTHAAALIPATAAVTDSVPRVIPKGFIWSDGDYAPIEVPTAIAAWTPLTAGAPPLNYDGIRFPLTIHTDDTSLAGISSGLGRLSLDVPVVNVSVADADNQEIPDLKKPVVWFIRGGMNNALIDQGKTFNQNRGSLGGAILIGVGNVLSGAGGFIIETK